jgi:hypothetical protein
MTEIDVKRRYMGEGTVEKAILTIGRARNMENKNK